MNQVAENSLDVSVVIVSYNVKDLLFRCLESLFAFNSKISLEVIVIENASSDASASMVSEAFPQVILVENKKNAGFPKANNQGFKIAKGKYILMLNPDTEFIDNAIEKLFHILQSESSLALIAPRLLNTDLSLQISAWRFPTLYSVFCDLFFLNSINKKHFYADKDLNMAFSGDSFSGAALFFRSNLLKTIHGLDETMFWIEDIDFCYRLSREGHKLEYRPEVEIIHHSGQSAKKNYNISISNQIFNKIKYIRKHENRFSYRIVQLMSFIHVLVKIAAFGLLSPFRIVYFRKLRAYVYTLPKVFNPPNGIA